MAVDANNESKAVSRRTIIKGAAWSAPVMIAAVAVPAAVASEVPTSIDPVATAFVGTGAQNKTFTLDPALAVGTTVSVVLSGPFVFTGGLTSSTVIVGAGGVISLDIQPTAAGTGTLSVSNSGGNAWGPLAVSLSLLPASVSPTSFAFSSGTASPTFTLGPAPVIGSSVNLSLSGTGYTFAGGVTSTTATVGAGGTVQVTINAGTGAGALTVSGAGWSLPVSLSVTIPTVLTRSPATALPKPGVTNVTFGLGTFTGDATLTINNTGNANGWFHFVESGGVTSMVVTFTGGSATVPVFVPNGNGRMSVTAVRSTVPAFNITTLGDNSLFN